MYIRHQEKIQQYLGVTLDKTLKRISLLIREEQYETLNERGLNLSGLIRDLIDDHLADDKITLSVSEETRTLYDKIISNSGSSDREIESHFRQALKGLLDEKIKEMQELKKEFSSD